MRTLVFVSVDSSTGVITPLNIDDGQSKRNLSTFYIIGSFLAYRAESSASISFETMPHSEGLEGRFGTACRVQHVTLLWKDGQTRIGAGFDPVLARSIQVRRQGPVVSTWIETSEMSPSRQRFLP